MPLSLKPTPTPSTPELPGILPGGPGVTPEKLAELGHALIPYAIGAGVLLAVWIITGVVLAHTLPRTWWYLYGFWFLRLRMNVTWRRLCLNAGLTAVDRPTAGQTRTRSGYGSNGAPIVPLLRRVRPRAGGATAVIMFSAGQTPEQFIEAADALAHAWRVHAVRVLASGRGKVAVTILRNDPLATVSATMPAVVGQRQESGPAPVRRRQAKAAIPVQRRAGQAPRPADLIAPVGNREDGEAWRIDLTVFPHWLITGATRSGKSTLINAAVARWASRPIALVGIDCKGGMELGPHAPRLSALATDRHQAADLLTALVDDAQQRMRQCRQHGARNIWQLPEDVRPVPVVAIVDELAELYLVASREEKEAAQRATTNLLRLAQLGAALGIHLIVAGQRVGSDFGSGVTALRAQLGGRICLAVNDKETALMTLGDLYPEAVEAAQLISPEEKGVAITTAGSAGWVRARSINFTHYHLDLAIKTYADLTPDLPGISRPTLL
jgi:S-DNA-T family DNA segregation ATPase FtsK/SpoIIIE